MKVPPGKTEAEVLRAIEKAVNILAPSFEFGPYDTDDIKQEGFVFALEVLEKEKYDPSRPLENFLYTHVRNRLINFRRNKFRRNDPPCKKCHDGEPCPSAGAKDLCDKYRSWLKRNTNKANICNPITLDSVKDEGDQGVNESSSVEQAVETQELLELIDKNLPIELRAVYLQMRSGVSVPKTARLRVERAIIEICGGAIEECPSESD